MVKALMSLILIIFLLSNISAVCNETQININTANLTELDKMTGIGPAKAQAIIDSRPFSSVDDLIRVNGIGNTTLSNIKTQGLACVNESAEETYEQLPEENAAPNVTEQIEDNLTVTTPNTAEKTGKTVSNSKTPATTPTTKAVTLEAIDLNSKDIKSENNNENLGKNLALGGITTFCLLFGTMFFLKFARRKKENEFR